LLLLLPPPPLLLLLQRRLLRLLQLPPHACFYFPLQAADVGQPLLPHLSPQHSIKLRPHQQLQQVIEGAIDLLPLFTAPCADSIAVGL
jgi:hypothetical protein